MGQWSELPEQFLEAIDERVVLYVDKVRLRSVCASWHSTLPKLPHQKFHQSPCLLLPSRNNSVRTCGLFSPLDKKFYHLELPELAEGRLFIGSSHGWVVTCEDSSSLRLFNPLTRAHLKLPPTSCFPDIEKYYSSDSGYEYALRDYLGHAYTLSARHVRDHFMHKIILSTSPANDCWDYFP
ncbi:probable F-box protein At1g65740 [Rhododendron vialii]|uniref:probable F-box protein At1g65740 n=1 Tax=Rhododendron vialii TaxID=182163 RepID=UPI00265FEBCF|nr:probable F-box protein At1g65740 [Rhododendron vialii]